MGNCNKVPEAYVDCPTIMQKEEGKATPNSAETHLQGPILEQNFSLSSAPTVEVEGADHDSCRELLGGGKQPNQQQGPQEVLKEAPADAIPAQTSAHQSSPCCNQCMLSVSIGSVCTCQRVLKDQLGTFEDCKHCSALHEQ